MTTRNVLIALVGAANLCTIHTETPAYTIDMSFPADYPDQRALAEILTRQRDQFVTTVEEPPVRDVPKALDIKPTTYRSGTPGLGTESLVLEEDVNVGGAHPETYYDAVIFFIGQGMWTIEAAGPQQVSVPRSELASILA